MKRVGMICLLALAGVTPAHANQMNLDPYFSAGASSIKINANGTESTSPSTYFAVGTSLNWISPNIGMEFRFGTGGQYTAFNGTLNLYTSYLLRPSYDLGSSYNVYGLVGVSTMLVTVGDINQSDTGLSYGAGIAYRIPDESLLLQAEWMSYRTDANSADPAVSNMDISGASIGVTFFFD